jgi:galactose-1-phosphate uridylyltransferase
MFFSRKHDLLQMTYKEFKDFLYLPTQWFSKVQEKDADYKYPAILWDFLVKAGASQIHPHSMLFLV